MNMAVKAANQVLNIAVLVAVMAMLALGGYVMWDSSQVYAQASETNYATYKPSDESDLSFQDLQKINPEVVAWLDVYGTHIDYPVTQGTDNMKYVNTDAMGDYSLSGAIFLDASNSPNFTDINNIVFGHHMDADTMFGELTNFADADYFRIHQYGSLFVDGQTHGIQFIAFVHADAYDESVYDTKVTEQNEDQYVASLENIATNVRGDVSVKAGERLILLSTCAASTTNGRDILVGKITNTAQPDTFPKSADTNTSVVGVVDAVVNQNTLTISSVVVLVCVMAGTATFYLRKKRKAGSRGGDQ